MAESQKLAWSQVKFLGQVPSARSSHSVSLYGGNKRLIIFGGYGETDNEANFYHVDTRTWKSEHVASIDQTGKTARVGHSAVVLGKHLYVFGGWNGKEYLDYGFVFDFEDMKMILEQNKDRKVPAPRRDHSLCLIGSRIFLFGGWNILKQHKELWVLDDAWKWTIPTVRGDCPGARRGHTATAVGSVMYMFGGIYGNSKYLNDMYMLDTETMEWTRKQPTGDLPTPRAWHSAISYGRCIVFFGGTAGRTAFNNDVYVYQTHKNRFVKLATSGLPLSRCSHTANLLDGKMLVFGGITPSSGENKIYPLNDLHLLDLGEIATLEEMEPSTPGTSTSEAVST